MAAVSLKSPLLLTVWFLVANLYAETLTQVHGDAKYTTTATDKDLFSREVSDLNDSEQDRFIIGKSFFHIPWVEAPSATTARDGLGPLFNANTCASCHPNNGIGRIYNKNNEISRNYVTRLSIPSNGSKAHQKMLKLAGFVEEPVYGGQISINAVPGVPYEAKPLLRYRNITMTYPDGEKVTLKRPLRGIKYQLKDLQYGTIHKEVSITNRLAPALVGLGLLEQISDVQILAYQDIDDRDGDGISGKANRVYSLVDEDFRVGRYTWKASAPSVLQQSAAAAYNDMGLTNLLFPKEYCTKYQKACLNAAKADLQRAGTPFDLPMERLQAITFYLKHLKIPKSTITQKEGEKLFLTIGCIKCHRASFRLASGYSIKPFSDLLLHDMGEALSDGRSEFLATAREWRTAPLWSLGKYEKALGQPPELLHDGRAKSIEEAILWHGGEAKGAQERFMNLSKEEREKVIAYIREL